MDVTCPPNSVATKIFTTTEKPPMRRIYGYVEPALYQELLTIAESEDLDISAAIRELLALALRYYKFKKGTLNNTKADNAKTFYCQSCKVETKMRYVCYKNLDFDQYLICEECMFNKEKLSKFVAKILQGV